MEKNIINRAQIKKTLPYGAIKEIAKRSNVSIFTVSRVLKGGSKNPIVLNVLKNYLKEIYNTATEINALVTV